MRTESIQDSKNYTSIAESGPRFKFLEWKYSNYIVKFAAGLGILLAFLVVVAWFPNTWSMRHLPIHTIDAPSHYYFVRKLLLNGPSTALSLYPNDSFYPPLFHLTVWALIKIASVFGCTINIFAAVNLVWIVASGLIFPAGMLLWCSYFTRDLDWPCKAFLYIVLPVLAVSSVAHPYWYLSAGPLLAYGFATSILPFLLYASLRLIDVITDSQQRTSASIVRWISINLALGIVLLLSHPRIAFTYLVFVAFFVLLKFPWKLILSSCAALFVAVLLFAAYVMHRDHGKNYLNPSTWFHTFQPTRTFSDAFRIFITDFLPGVPGVLMAVLVCLSLLASLLISGRRIKDGIALVLSYLLTGAIYISSSALTGPIPNILTAPWYRVETRPISMIPFAVIPLLAFGSSCIVTALGSNAGRNKYCGRIPVLVRTVIVAIWLTAILALTCTAQLANDTRQHIGLQVQESTSLDQADPSEQLTHAKYKVLTESKRLMDPDGVLISDPMNGSMYAMSLYGINTLYPVYNPLDTKNGKIFGDVESAFASGDGQRLLRTVCPVNPSYTKRQGRTSEKAKKYFLSMGPQAPSLHIFTYKAKYDPFHSQDLLKKFIDSHVLLPIQSFTGLSPEGQDWTLYEFQCRP